MDDDAGTDSGLLAPTWAGAPVEAQLTDEAWLRAMVDVEVALVRAQAACGVAPASAAAAIAEAAETARLDVRGLARQARAAANPVVAFVPAFTALVSAVDPAAAEYVHRGSTSQDILDSAAMLIGARVLDRIGADLVRVSDALARLADEHRHTLMAGRTLTQHAVPTTFGLKAAGWLTGVTDALIRVRQVRAALPAQLGGAAGTLAAYQEYARLDGPDGDFDATALIAPFAAELGLAEPVLPWHVLRTPNVELGGALQLVVGALGKFALDVQTLSRTEIAELAEPAADGRGASSAMPQKRNPVLATLIVTAARQVPAYVCVLAAGMLAEDERPAGAWHAEWQPLREALRLAGGAAHTAAELAEGLVVDVGRMRANVGLTRGSIVAERLNVALAPVLGKATAKKLLTRAAQTAAGTGDTLADVLAGDEELAGRIGAADLLALLDPAGYVGPVDALVDRAVRHCHTARRGEGPGVNVGWGITVDCADPARLAAFWRVALGYVDAPVPAGFASWEQWLLRWKVPPEQWNDGAYLVDPDGAGPGLSLLKVPEPKVVKNRLHLDLKVGGRDQPQEIRWPRVTEKVRRLVAAGATVVREDLVDGVPDHVVLADPEGNEFCVV